MDSAVTSFFRDEDVFAALTQDVFPALVQNRNPDVPIRIWVAGCATGERDLFPLPLACWSILADNPLGPVHNQYFFATDVNEQSVEVARLGWFTPRPRW